jgi:Fe-S-cluster formation regulator IscX/YfhJ
MQQQSVKHKSSETPSQKANRFSDEIPEHLQERFEKHMQTLHTVKVHTPRLSDLMLEEQTPLGQYESHKAIRELNRFHQDPCNEKADRFLENSRKLRDAYAVKTEIEQKVKNLTQQNDDPDAEEETFEEKVLRL